MKDLTARVLTALPFAIPGIISTTLGICGTYLISKMPEASNEQVVLTGIGSLAATGLGITLLTGASKIIFPEKRDYQEIDRYKNHRE